MTKIIKTSLAIIMLFGISLDANGQTEVPHEFEAGQPAVAAEVNENFSALADAIDATRTAIDGKMARVAVVAISGGSYTNPLDAVDNLDAGDMWCREPSNTNTVFCLIRIAPGVYEVDRTLVIPRNVSVIGSGIGLTEIVAEPGIDTTLFIEGSESGRPDYVSEMTIRNEHGDAARSVSLALGGAATVQVEYVSISATGSAANIGVEEQNYTWSTFRHVEISARGGTEAYGMHTSGVTSIKESVVNASGATSLNHGVRHDGDGGGRLSVQNSTVSVRDGLTAIGISFSMDDGSMNIFGGSIRASGASESAYGIRGGGSASVITIRDANVVAASNNRAAGILIKNDGGEFFVERVNSDGSGGVSGSGMMISAYTGGPIIDSVLEGSHVGLNINFFGSSGADIYRSTLSGDIAALELPDDTEFDGNVNVIFSRFDGPLIVPVTVEGNISCAAVIDQTDTFFANQCPP